MSTKTHQKYRLKDGTFVPGVTTILGILEKRALIHWAWDLGCKGEDYRKVRDKAANIGTCAHYMIECHLKNIEPELGDYSANVIKKAKNAFNAFLEFEKINNLEVIASELQLVSESMKCGGTIDLYAKLNNKKALIDFKSSKSVWVDHRVQLAGYKEILEENNYPVEESHILQIDKETGDFHHYQFKDLSLEIKFFKGLCKIYPLKKILWERK